MPPEEKTTEEVLNPIVVATIGNKAEVQTGTIVTPEGKANFISKVVPTAQAIFIRAGHRFVDALIGAEALSTIDDAADWNLITGGAFKAAVLIAVMTAGWGVIRDLSTIFSGLERSHPLSVGNV